MENFAPPYALPCQHVCDDAQFHGCIGIIVAKSFFIVLTIHGPLLKYSPNSFDNCKLQIYTLCTLLPRFKFLNCKLFQGKEYSLKTL